MKLTEQQLYIQKRADKTPSFGCLFTSNYFSAEEAVFRICDRRDNLTPSSNPYGRLTPEYMKPKPGEQMLCTSDMVQGSIIFARVGYKEIINIYASDKCEFDWRKFTDTMKILGHPMNRGRLYYLYMEAQSEYFKQNNGNCKDFYAAFEHMYRAASDEFDIFQQTVLERSPEFQKLVIAFLESLPDNTDND